MPLQTALVGGVASRLGILSAAALVILAIACANIVFPSLSRAATRERQIGIRTAIGGGPRRIARQLLTEHLLLAGIGAAAGFLLAWPFLTVLTRVPAAGDAPPRRGGDRVARAVLQRPPRRPHRRGLRPGASSAHAAPATAEGARRRRPRGRRRRRDPPDPAAPGGRPNRRRRAARHCRGPVVRSLWTLSSVDPGFRTSGLVTARLAADDAHCTEPARSLAFYRTLEDRLRAVPGVRGAALVNALPLAGGLAKQSLGIEGYTAPAGKPAPLFRLTIVTPTQAG